MPRGTLIARGKFRDETTIRQLQAGSVQPIFVRQVWPQLLSECREVAEAAPDERARGPGAPVVHKTNRALEVEETPDPAIARSYQLAALVHGARLVLSHRHTRRACVAAFGAVAAVAVSQGSPLAWDESVFSTRGRDVAESGFAMNPPSGNYWGDHRPPGLPMFQGFAFWLFGSNDLVARGVVVGFAVLSLIALGALLDLFFRPHVGTLAVALTAWCPGFLAASTLVFGDVPSLLFVLLSLYFLARALIDHQDSWLVLIPPLLTVGTMVRFGSIMLVAVPLALLGVWFLRDRLLRRGYRSMMRLAIAAIATVFGMLVVLNTTLLTTTSSPLEISRAIGNASTRPPDRWRTDLADILQPGPVGIGFGESFWSLTYAAMFALLSAVALLLLVFRARWALATAAVLTAITPVVLYAVTVNQFVTTYLAPIFAGWAVAVSISLFPREDVLVSPFGSSGSTSDDPSAPTQTSLAVHAGVALVAIGSLTVIVSSTRATMGVHDGLQGFNGVRSAATIADDLIGRPCALGTARTPQVAWYSDCSTVSFGGLTGLFDGIDDDEDIAELNRRAGAGVEVGVLLMEGPSGQPNLDATIAALDDGAMAVLTDETGRRVVVGGVRSSD